MSRVEKWRRYREEIANMNFETYSSKKAASKRIEKFISENNSSQLNYEGVMEIREIYGNSESISKKKYKPHIRPSQIRYWTFAGFVIIVLVIALIFVGINAWR